MIDTVNRAKVEIRTAYLSTDFGFELAVKKTGLTFAELAEKCGVYKRGTKKGKLKGFVRWLKVVKGGWVKTGAYDFDVMQAHGFVIKPGACHCFDICTQDYNTDFITVVISCDVEKDSRLYNHFMRKR